MSTVEFFFDPMCPWAWITSRWVREVADQRGLDVRWRFISLEVLNEEQLRRDAEAIARGEEPEMPAAYGPISRLGNRFLRVAAAVRELHGNEAVGDFYTAVGEQMHPGGRSKELWEGADPDGVYDAVLAAAGVGPEVLQVLDDDRWAKIVCEESDLAIERTGEGVGTPIITFDVDRPDESSLFGPVINRIPRGEEAVRLWEAVETVARTPGIAELKRSIRGEPRFD
jgi:2-hydroxychromene-2-carboxylate isomerase